MKFYINYMTTLNNHICKKMNILRHLTTAEEAMLKSLRDQHEFS